MVHPCSSHRRPLTTSQTDQPNWKMNDVSSLLLLKNFVLLDERHHLCEMASLEFLDVFPYFKCVSEKHVCARLQAYLPQRRADYERESFVVAPAALQLQ